MIRKPNLALSEEETFLCNTYSKVQRLEWHGLTETFSLKCENASYWEHHRWNLRTLKSSDEERTATTRNNQKKGPEPELNTEKDPDDWITGGEPMTGKQASYLKKLCDEMGEAFDPNLTKAEASKRIDELQHNGR